MDRSFSFSFFSIASSDDSTNMFSLTCNFLCSREGRFLKHSWIISGMANPEYYGKVVVSRIAMVIYYVVPFDEVKGSLGSLKENRSRFPAVFTLFAGIWTVRNKTYSDNSPRTITWKQVNRDERPTSGLSPRHNSARLSISFPRTQPVPSIVSA